MIYIYRSLVAFNSGCSQNDKPAEQESRLHPLLPSPPVGDIDPTNEPFEQVTRCSFNAEILL